MPPTTRVIAVGSGKGGVGKSSITANLAAALAARGFTVGVLDADIWGFSIPRMLGVKGRLAGEKTRRRQGKIAPNEVKVGAGVLRIVSMGLLVDDEDTALMWRGLILAKALEQFLVDVSWGELDYLLIDMPPGHRRHPDGVVAPVAADRDARRDDTRAWARRRSRPASPTWRAARTSRCSASSRT